MRGSIKERFDIDPYQGLASLTGIKKEGYEVISIIRKNSKAIVEYKKIDKGDGK